MKETLLKKKFLITFCVLMGIISAIAYLYPAKEEAVPTRVLLENIGGRVVFDHKVHVEQYDLDCETCHHESLDATKNVIACGVCHNSIPSNEEIIILSENIIQNSTEEELAAEVTFGGETMKKPLNIAPYHDTAVVTDFAACLTCHHLEFTPKDWGHDAHIEEFGLSCESCHHEDKDIEPEPMNCNECHFEGAGVTLRDAVHPKCAECHQEWFDEGIESCAQCHDRLDTRKAYKEKGSFKMNPTYDKCSSCHGDVEPNTLFPNKMQSFHLLCMDCHESRGVGPYKDTQCAQCHITQ